MHVLIIEPSSLIPVQKYGGTERIIWDLGKTLHQLGHKVSFLVKEGSHCDFASVFSFDHNRPLQDQIPATNIDLVHFHSYFTPLKIPSVHTLHGHIVTEDFFNENTIFISKKHAAMYGSEVYVHNGLDWDNYGTVNLKQKREHYHFLAKASWKIKNLNGAIKTALKADQKLEVMGGEKWNFRNLKSNTFSKLNPKIRYHGMVDNNYKISVMERSKGLLFPVLWHEPFGLAVIESLYCGAPAFGTPYGALPELIIPEVGYISNKIEVIKTHMLEQQYDPKMCQEYAIDQFSALQMTKKYLFYYEKVLNKQPLNNTPCQKIQDNDIFTFD